MIKLTECLKSHAENELKLAGYNIVDPVDNVQSDDDYDNAITQNVYDMIKVFSNG